MPVMLDSVKWNARDTTQAYNILKYYEIFSQVNSPYVMSYTW